jgi:colanic acid/amylovoran biosynthesis protein
MKVSRHKKQLILLPQAFGPFVNKDVAKWCKALIDRSALCFPRDKTSFSNVVNLVGKSKKVVQFPDFTLAVSPSEDACLSASGRVLVVPNYRMLDKRDANLDYITFLVRAFALIRAKGLDPAFLIHDAVEDLRIVDLARNEGLSAEVISHDDPRVLKKLLAEASFVIGSRFHSLVSALSCAAGRAEAVSNIQNATRALKIKVDTMWELVESVLASASGKGLTAKR